MYQPLYIAGNKTGLVQERENFLLPSDAYPVLENIYVFRERLKRKQGTELLGRLRRKFSASSLGATGASPWSFNIYSTLAAPITGEPNAEIEVGSVTIVLGGAITFTDGGDGTLSSVTPGNSGTINYASGDVVLTHTGGGAATITFNYFPGLPCMGLLDRELNNVNSEQLVAFDTKYAYNYSSGFQEFISGTTWSGTNSDFFWSTNYWVTPGASNKKLFWVTNFSGSGGDPIRYTDDSVWIDFAPTIDSSSNKLTQCLILLPFRGRLVAFNTFEGTSLGASAQYRQRIRWAAIGNPISDISTLFPAASDVSADAWRDDIRGKGGFLDIPTAENIIAVGQVRDNLIVYTERSTWQLRYTGRSIAPFQIERVNSELGAESTFSAVQFDTSLVGIGDKGIVECDSYKSERIDVKIPDFVYSINNQGESLKRIHGIRDFQKRLAYWCYPYDPEENESSTFKYPNRRLVYNYENDSWAIFVDSFTCFGIFQNPSSLKWEDIPYPWLSQNIPWIGRLALFPSLIGGNQQGFVSYLDVQATNDVSLEIKDITMPLGPTLINSPDHNLFDNQIIEISNIPSGTGYASLNDTKFRVSVSDEDNFNLYAFNTTTSKFDILQEDTAQTYIGGGRISVKDNFKVVSKKFNFLEEGQAFQLGHIDILMNDTSEGEITLNVYQDYNDQQPINQSPENETTAGAADLFFNSTVLTSNEGGANGSKNWHRVYCNVRGSFITIEWTLNDDQMNGNSQRSDVQIDAQIVWSRKAGKELIGSF